MPTRGQPPSLAKSSQAASSSSQAGQPSQMAATAEPAARPRRWRGTVAREQAPAEMDRGTTEAQARGSAQWASTAPWAATATTKRRRLSSTAVNLNDSLKSLGLPVPDWLLSAPHEAVPAFSEDWTRVPGSHNDPDLKAAEVMLRDRRNKLLREILAEGRPVFYQSTGNMWPLVQSNDSCFYRPIQDVTAEDGFHAFHKDASRIEVGDIVFCLVQDTQEYFAHIVLRIQDNRRLQQLVYRIGNIEGRINGYCFRKHIFGILARVKVWRGQQWHPRPHPKTVFARVHALVQNDRWSAEAARLCEPQLLPAVVAGGEGRNGPYQ